MRRLRLQRDDPTRKERARDWERTARVALLMAIGLLAAATSPRWAVGDLLGGLYFAAVSLLLWCQTARIRLARAAAPFTRPIRVALVMTLGVGALLVAIDIATRGAL